MFVASPTVWALGEASDVAPVKVRIAAPRPVVMVVFDELPLDVDLDPSAPPPPLRDR